MPTLTTPADMRAWADKARREGLTIGFVPTMGALHAGHLELIRAATAAADVVVVSIFVNPMQFGQDRDFDGYPRPIEADIALCDSLGVSAVYAPTASTVYPPGFQTRVLPGQLAEGMEGAARAGHFGGVTTVLVKLFSVIAPHLAVFGEKDYQQLAVVRQMVRDFDLGIEVVGFPTVREPDGLAISSRNALLTAPQRAAATCLPNALQAAVDVGNRGADSRVADILSSAREVIDTEPTATLEYIDVFDATTLTPIETLTPVQRSIGAVRIAAAIQIGAIRLIDNRDLFGR